MDTVTAKRHGVSEASLGLTSELRALLAYDGLPTAFLSEVTFTAHKRDIVKALSLSLFGKIVLVSTNA